jgi:HSP20 family molecular chaperone IbpA
MSSGRNRKALENLLMSQLQSSFPRTSVSTSALLAPLTRWPSDSGFPPMPTFARPWEEYLTAPPAIAPNIDVREDQNGILIKADLPSGVKMEDVHLQVEEDGNLILTGERKEEKEEKDVGGFHIQERAFGSFERNIQIPLGTVPTDIDATMVNGTFLFCQPSLILSCIELFAFDVKVY